METPNSAAAERVLTHRACERAGPDCHFFFFFPFTICFVVIYITNYSNL